MTFNIIKKNNGDAEMCYKAIEKYYTEKEYGSVQCTDIIGFGYCNSLEEMQKRYASHIILEEITEQELQELWAEVKKLENERL